MATCKNDNKKDGTVQNAAVTVELEKEIGIVHLSPTRAVSVALIRTQAGYDYIAIRRLSRSSKRAAWKSIDKLWIPFAGAAEISGMINIAHNIGCRKSDWVESKHRPIEITIFKDNQTSIPPIVEPTERPVVKPSVEGLTLTSIPVQTTLNFSKEEIETMSRAFSNNKPHAY